MDTQSPEASVRQTQQVIRTRFVTQYFLLDFETVVRLQVDPELRTHPEETPQPRRRVNRDPALAVHNLADSAPTTGRTTPHGTQRSNPRHFRP